MTPSFLRSLTLLLVLGSVGAQAQTKVPPRKSPVAPKERAAVSSGVTMKDGITLKESKVLVTQQGRTSPLTQDMTLINGTKISSTGAVTMTNGTTTTLKEGDMLSLSGRLTTATMKASQDSLLMATKEKTKEKSKRKK
ncbi:MAG TPA: DUF6799 domain-containing protein [Hymenobacter sp.]|jgi:hypothetical protein